MLNRPIKNGEPLCFVMGMFWDVQCDYHQNALGNLPGGHADTQTLEENLRISGQNTQPECLVLIKTTAPLGTRL